MAMEGFIWAATSVLIIVFLASLLGLILVCRHKYCRPISFLHCKEMRPEVNLISNENEADMELDDVRLHPNIEKILADEQWVDDATGLIPHCLAILKKCHHLTERLVTMMMTRVPQHTNQDLSEIVFIAKKISPRVDDVVRAMYPPLDPRLLEARCTALILSVNHMALVIRTLCQFRSCNWVELALEEMEENLQVLREAGLAVESMANTQKSSNSSECNESSTADHNNLNFAVFRNPAAGSHC